jgi:TatD DNase family protein
MLTDTHAHLASRQLTDDLPDIIDRARAAKVNRIICIGTNLEDSRRVLQIADTYPEVEACIGIHPCDADSVRGDAFIDELREMATHPKVVGIGEIGLDYFHSAPAEFTLPEWKEQQRRVLEAQLELAAELGLNVVLHNRESFHDLYAQVLPWSDRLRAVFHCFTGSDEDALLLMESGHMVSFTGIVTFKNSDLIQQTANAVPAGQFMLETDCPYLAPMPHRGQRNEPAHVAHTAAFIAQLRGISLEDLCKETTQAAAEFFRRPILE